MGELLESAATTLTTPAHCTVEDCRRGGRDGGGGGGQTNERTDRVVLLYSTILFRRAASEANAVVALSSAMLCYLSYSDSGPFVVVVPSLTTYTDWLYDHLFLGQKEFDIVF